MSGAQKLPQGVLDGGGGNDCIVTFRDGPTYVTKGGAGNDRIVANVPPGTSGDEIDAICAGHGFSAAVSAGTVHAGITIGRVTIHWWTVAGIVALLILPVLVWQAGRYGRGSRSGR